MSARFPYESRPALGLTALHEWLRANGVECGRTAAKAVQTEWIRQELATESRKVSTV